MLLREFQKLRRLYPGEVDLDAINNMRPIVIGDFIGEYLRW